MNTDLNALGTEYDALLSKPDKTGDDYHRLDVIEGLVWHYHGFSVATGELRANAE